MARLPVVCLVGSTKPLWKEQYLKVQRELAFRGYVVLSVSAFKVAEEDEEMESHRDLLEQIHFAKMDMAEAVVLIHLDAIGTHTHMEINRTLAQGKPFVVFHHIDQVDKALRAELGVS